jgi:choline kinase/phosphatidylglycerophosphate synthase
MQMATVRASEKILAVVIAAGHATRLRPYSETRPKALMELAPGVAVIDLILSQLHQVGVEDIVIASRAEHASVFEEHLNGRARVIVVKGDGFGNLHSLQAALEVVGPRRTLLIMSDHVFELEILRKMVEEGNGDKRVLLCLDMQPEHRDLREGLRVDASPQEVRRVGKEIPPYSGVDAGLFVLSPDVHDLAAQLDAASAGQATISDLVNSVAGEGAVGYVDITGKLWMDIDTPEDLLEARRRYWQIVRRGLYKPTDGPVSRWLNRPLSTRISLFLFKHAEWATPNLITLASFLLAVASTFLFIQTQLIIGAIMLHLSSVLDGVDGELARLRDNATAFGSLLDSILDRVADISLVVALGLLLSPGAIRLTLTALAVFGVVLVSYVSHLVPKHSNIRELRLGFPWATRDVRLFSITVGALIAQPMLPILFCATAPIVFVARALARLIPLRISPAPTSSIETSRGIPIPTVAKLSQPVESHEIRRNVESLIVNTLKAGLTLVVLQLLRSAVEPTSTWTHLASPLVASLIFDLSRLIVLAYFGYRILMSAKFLADRATDTVVSRLQITKSMYGRATADAFYLVVVILSWSVVAPIVAKLAEIGTLMDVAVNLAFLGFSLLILYDLLKILNRGFKWLWDEVIARLTQWVSTLLKPQDDEHTPATSDENH